MPGLDDVRRIALALPEVVEQVNGHTGGPGWRVRGKLFAWERPLRARESAELDAVPAGVILGVRTDGQTGKDAALARGAPACFTVSHFDGYPSVLVQLDLVDPGYLRELVVEGWAAQAPKRLAAQYFAES